MKLLLSLILSLVIAAPALATSLGTLGNGITAKEGASGPGYILFSPDGLASRFTLWPGQATSFAAVFYQNGTWYYYNNETAVPFTPVATDVLVASVDYSADTVSLLTGQNTFTHGIRTGYSVGDLAIEPNQYAGVVNYGEFTAIGTHITLGVPMWWHVRGVINSKTPNNWGMANIGQLKHTATAAHAELDGLLPGGADFVLPFAQPPADPDAAWYREQKKVLNLGQLKNVALPMYDRLDAIDSDWVKNQLEASGLSISGAAPHYPWDPTTPISESYKPANIGQLKVVYSLRFRDSADGDSAPDLMELAVFGDTDEVITSIHDTSDDGIVDYFELITGYGLPGVDSDMDGTTDSDELATGRDEYVKDHPAVGLSVVVTGH